uniref:Uncharacterized protein n=1 Tax=Trichogramma kaykai TaxID=54128 RepID=A0ABD2WDW7_9HYME
MDSIITTGSRAEETLLHFACRSSILQRVYRIIVLPPPVVPIYMKITVNVMKFICLVTLSGFLLVLAAFSHLLEYSIAISNYSIHLVLQMTSQILTVIFNRVMIYTRQLLDNMNNPSTVLQVRRLSSDDL